MSDDGGPLTRDELVDEFGEESVRSTEWWGDEMARLKEVESAILDAVAERDDVLPAKRHRSTSRDGRHTLGITLTVAGEPYYGDETYRSYNDVLDREGYFCHICGHEANGREGLRRFGAGEDALLVCVNRCLSESDYWGLDDV